ncbi:WXG100 family type VII secretion target [Oceanobacillus polygoni]|uniref:X-X-X-Leu-X-X-Gly heptad repeat protein n=1 Tax=Oceanobacillus polygoni TaxID=1235259 RepID=A0A9X0YVH1_9BACI|nr:YhgE/Pip domain-containing protein [Oceanobacillus polygoni]MBP2079605.1 X-X-X-Leu-X-X-Gly heptad repeat protein [Oceanobacillus polygoni]
MKKAIKWLWLTLAIFFLPVLTTHASPNASEETTDEEQENGKIASKNEVIYANLQAGGNLKGLYVVNSFELTKPGVIEDYGDYTEIKNLTDTSAIEKDKNNIRIHAETDNFYYQGNLGATKELPWNFTIDYYIDGKEVNAEDIPGMAGDVEIIIDVKQNRDVPATFFENYMLQISVPLNTDYFQEIEAEDATIANAGKNKQITFTMMPDEEKKFSIEATTDQFEIDGIEIAALPPSIAVDGPDTDKLTDEFRSLTDAIGEIDNGVGELRDGMDGLASGLHQLEDGSAQYKNGMDELNGSSSQLTDASSQINDALVTLQEEISKASGAAALDELEDLDLAVSDMISGLEELADGMDQFGSNYEEANQALQKAIKQIPEPSISEADIAALHESDADQEVIEELVTTYQAAQTVKGAYEAAAEAFGSVGPSLHAFSESTREVAHYLRALTDGLEESISQIDVDDGFNQLLAGIEEMASNYNQFHEGLIAYTNGVNELASSYQDIHTGIGESAAGADQLTDGAGELRNGTTQLHDATMSIPEEMQEEIDAMLSQYDKSDFEPISFVSEKNDELTDSVQFVIRTDTLKQEQETETTDEAPEEKEGFFEKLKNLFR